MRRDEADARLAAAGDEELLAGDGALHVPAEVVAELVGANVLLAWRVRVSGASGTRTHDLSDAIRTLSQLSYSPAVVASLARGHG